MSKRKEKKPCKHKNIKTRIYAIALGKMGMRAVSLYRDEWDYLEFLFSEFSKGRFKQVKSEVVIVKIGLNFTSAPRNYLGQHK